MTSESNVRLAHLESFLETRNQIISVIARFGCGNSSFDLPIIRNELDKKSYEFAKAFCDAYEANDLKED